jgi:hypothetical protein
VSTKAKAALALAGLLAGCLQQPDLAYLPVSLPPAYSDLPDAPLGTPIEPGMPIKLDPRQQEAVVAAVVKWMKDPGTASFGPMNAVKARHGQIVVCGEVSGRNSAGINLGMAPFVGVMMGKPASSEFIVVRIAQYGRPRAEVQAICQQSGIFS